MKKCMLYSVSKNTLLEQKSLEKKLIIASFFCVIFVGTNRPLRNILWDAGIYNFAPHTFGEASSSAMLQCGDPVDGILKDSRMIKCDYLTDQFAIKLC